MLFRHRSQDLFAQKPGKLIAHLLRFQKYLLKKMPGAGHLFSVKGIYLLYALFFRLDKEDKRRESHLITHFNNLLSLSTHPFGYEQH
jgi:hypothetical protein